MSQGVECYSCLPKTAWPPTSELSDRRVNHPKEVVQEGQWVTLRVIRVEPEKRRLGLSLKRVTHGEYMDEDWRSALAEVNQEETEAPAAEPPATESSANEEPTTS